MRYFLTGKCILRQGDNASFLYDATEDYRHKPIPKLTKARWRRVARRNAAVTVPLVLLALTPTDRVALWAVLVWLGFVVAAGAAWLGWRATVRFGTHNPYRWMRNRRVNREFIDPAAEVLMRILGARYIKSRARRSIELPHGWGTGDDVGTAAPKVARVWLSPGVSLDAGMKKRITEQVGARLGIPHPVGAWNEAGAAPFVDIQGAPNAPKEVTWTSLLPAIARCAETETVLGGASGGRFVTVSSAEDSPHFAMSGPSGTGKSVTGKVFFSQRLRRGDGVFMLDPKKWSHWRWAGGGKLPADRLVYAYKTVDIHNSWLAIHAEAERRIELDEEELNVQRRVWIGVEEINTATKRLTRWWTQERRRRMSIARSLLKEAEALRKESDGALSLEEAAAAVGLDLAELELPATSPAVVAMQESVGMGRELKMHVVVMAQRLSASVFGGNGGDIRESFAGGRLIARWDRKLWKMLVDTLAYVACPTGGRGIWGLARGEEFIVFRVPNLSDKEATAFALGGNPVYGPVLGPQSTHGSVEGESWASLAGQEERAAITSAVTLSQAFGLLPGREGPDTISESAFKRAANRKGFPDPLPKPDGSKYGIREARLYDLSQITEWYEGRV